MEFKFSPSIEFVLSWKLDEVLLGWSCAHVVLAVLVVTVRAVLLSAVTSREVLIGAVTDTPLSVAFAAEVLLFVLFCCSLS